MPKIYNLSLKNNSSNDDALNTSLSSSSTMYDLRSDANDAEELEALRNSVPSMEYISYLVSEIEDALIDIQSGNKFYGLQPVETDEEDLPIGLSTEEDIDVTNLRTNNTRRFLSDKDINIFKDKINKYDLQAAIDTVKEYVESEVDKTYKNIINMPKVIKSARILQSILYDSEPMKNIVEMMADKIDADDLAKHARSNTHMTSKDRIAMNAILNTIRKGTYSDWKAPYGDITHIKNKPTSLPADGGNADTIGGEGIEKIGYKRIFDVVVAKNANKSYECDINVDNNALNISNVINGVNTVYLRSGEYAITDCDICGESGNEKECVLNGAGNSTVLHVGDIHLNNITLKDMTIFGGNVYIESNCKIDNVHFNRCNIIFNSASNNDIRFSKFENCKHSFDGNVMRNSIIVYNRFINSDMIKYYADGNIVNNNL